MPYRRKTAASEPVTRPSRLSKTKAGATIRNSITKTSRSPVSPTLLSPRSRRTMRQPSPTVQRGEERPPTPFREFEEEPFVQIYEKMDKNQQETRQLISELFTQFLDARELPQVPNSSVPNTSSAQNASSNSEPPFIPLETSQMFPTTCVNQTLTGMPPRHNNVLSQYPWVDIKLVDDIALGTFDISSLPKLHREEEFRNQHIAKSAIEGGVIQYSLDKSKPTEVILGRSKLHRTFTHPNSFLSAWQVYVSIRTSFHPERAPSLAYWTERLLFYIQLSYPWNIILNYIVAYFQRHQNAPSQQFYSVDAELVSNHFSVYQQKSLISAANTSSKSSKLPSGNPLAKQICLNWNRESGCTFKETTGRDCLRRHVCLICQKEGHKSAKCPPTSPSKGTNF
jgi:hypothetical protein